ncbi:MAG: GTP cyclohydrolase I FolE, partial [Clostridia bacterium]
MVDKEKLERAVKLLLEAIGENPEREGLKETPSRVARMYEELTSGYEADADEMLAKCFQVDGTNLVVERDINFSSMCEHHLMPFFGKVHIAYIPNGKVVGLSKLARVVDVYARRLQLQERFTSQIADEIMLALQPVGVFVAVQGEHTCMTARGVKKIGSKTLSTAVRGDIDPALSAQLLQIFGE